MLSSIVIGNHTMFFLLALLFVLLLSGVGSLWSQPLDPGASPDFLNRSGSDRFAKSAYWRVRDVIVQRWSGTEWQNARREFYLLPSDSTGWVLQEWDSSGWKNNRRVVWKLDASRRISEECNDTWNGIEWKRESRHAITRNGRGAIMSIDSYVPSELGWSEVSRRSYTYDASHREIEILTEIHAESGWDPHGRRVSIWNVGGRKIESRDDVWFHGSWQYSQRTLFGYTGEGLLQSQRSQLWRDSEWANASLRTSRYRPDGQPTEDVVSRWNHAAAQWDDSSRTTHAYDDRGYIVGGLIEVWRDSLWVNDERYAINWEELADPPTSWNDRPTAFLLGNYPNPFNPVTTLAYEIFGAAEVTLQFFALDGREVGTRVEYRQPGVYFVEWDASHMPSGAYFVRLHAGNYTATRRLMLVR